MWMLISPLSHTSNTFNNSSILFCYPQAEFMQHWSLTSTNVELEFLWKLWGRAHNCSSFKTLKVKSGAEWCMNCNFSLSSSVSVNILSHLVDSSFSLTWSCFFPPHPALLLSSVPPPVFSHVSHLSFSQPNLSPPLFLQHGESISSVWVSSHLRVRSMGFCLFLSHFLINHMNIFIIWGILRGCARLFL